MTRSSLWEELFDPVRTGEHALWSQQEFVMKLEIWRHLAFVSNSLTLRKWFITRGGECVWLRGHYSLWKDLLEHWQKHNQLLQSYLSDFVLKLFLYLLIMDWHVLTNIYRPKSCIHLHIWCQICRFLAAPLTDALFPAAGPALLLICMLCVGKPSATWLFCWECRHSCH